MKLNKLQRFEAIKTFPNLLEKPENVKGTWHTQIFNNTNPITLELACGKGEYAIGLSQLNPNQNFIGVDIKGNRQYIGAKKALDENISNVRFLRTQINQLQDYFEPQDIAEIWITFPDPFLRDSRERHRLTHPRFLEIYQKILKPQAYINLKTDSPQLYAFTKQTLQQQNCTIHTDIEDIYAPQNQAQLTPQLHIKTFYEGMHLAANKKIYYLKFQLPQTPIVQAPKKTKPNAQP